MKLLVFVWRLFQFCISAGLLLALLGGGMLAYDQFTRPPAAGESGEEQQDWLPLSVEGRVTIIVKHRKEGDHTEESE